jgi:hypothetical protein
MALMDAMGSKDPDFMAGLLNQIASVSSSGAAVNEDRLNFVLSIVKGIEPRDQVEAMLAAQMAVTHQAIMTFARRLANVETIPQQDSAERAFNKLGRTFAAQVEALKRHRSTGEQRVTVQHVNVNDGGQAIVGNVTQGGGLPTKTKDQPHAQVADAPGFEMPRQIEKDGAAVPVTGSDGP